jgi:DNA-binding MarR family transcriptional regulator
MSDDAPSGVPDRLALVVGRLNRRLTLAPSGLSHGLLTALSSVRKRGPLRLAELATIEGVSPPGATRIVAELESRGLLARSVDPDDGRAFRIQITDAGNQAILEARAARSSVIAARLANLDEADLAAIEAALSALEKAAGEP